MVMGMALLLSAAPAAAKPRHRSHHVVNLFARRTLTAVADGNTATTTTSFTHGYLGASTVALQPALMFRDPLYPLLYAPPGVVDWTGLALSLASIYTPQLRPTLAHAPVLPIPTMTAGAYGISLWGRIR